jgi:YwqJ-like deaminase
VDPRQPRRAREGHETLSTAPLDQEAAPRQDPRLGWSGTQTGSPPQLEHRRDGILPAVAAALSVGGETLTCTAGKGDQPPQLHPLVQDFLDALATAQRERFTGRCPEAILLSRHLTAVEADRSKRARKKPLTHSEAKRSLKHAKLTARRIREDGDPLHGSYAPPCRSCAPLLGHFGVRPVDPTQHQNG